MSLKKSNKGFSLVELLVVIAIITVAVALVGGSMSTVYHARSQKAAQTLDAMIAQTKIDALSGMTCSMYLSYDEDEDEYVCEIFRSDGSSRSIKTETFGNANLTIKAGNYNIKDGYMLNLAFSKSTGAFEHVYALRSSDHTFYDLMYRRTESKITLTSGGTHTITLYKSTGEHVLDA